MKLKPRSTRASSLSAPQTRTAVANGEFERLLYLAQLVVMVFSSSAMHARLPFLPFAVAAFLCAHGLPATLLLRNPAIKWN